MVVITYFTCGKCYCYAERFRNTLFEIARQAPEQSKIINSLDWSQHFVSSMTNTAILSEIWPSAGSKGIWRFPYLLFDHYQIPYCLQIFPFSLLLQRANGRCERSAEDAHPWHLILLLMCRDPCLLCSCIVFFFWTLDFTLCSLSWHFILSFKLVEKNITSERKVYKVSGLALV